MAGLTNVHGFRIAVLLGPIRGQNKRTCIWGSQWHRFDKAKAQR